MGDNARRRIIITFPTHPLYFISYFILLIPLSLIAPGIYSFLVYSIGIPFRFALLFGLLLFTMSLLLSPVNIVIREYTTGEYSFTISQKYVFFYGIPIPIIFPVITARRIVLAINIGGAVIPVTTSIVLFARLMHNPYYLLVSFVSITATTIVSYIFSRAIPGAGIAVPGLLPPMTAAFTTLIFVRNPIYSPTIAYIGGVIGSLIGADVLRLKKELYKFLSHYGSAFLSIGGAGTFDGIYLSGIFAVILSLIFT